MSEKIHLGGRIFVIQEVSTIERDYFCMSRIRAAGLETVTIQDGETPEDLVKRILNQTVDAGVTFELLAGMLTPEGLEWSPEVAKETAEFIKHLTAAKDKAVVNSQIVSLLIGFFESAISSVRVTPSSSKETVQDEQPRSIH